MRTQRAAVCYVSASTLPVVMCLDPLRGEGFNKLTCAARSTQSKMHANKFTGKQRSETA